MKLPLVAILCLLLLACNERPTVDASERALEPLPLEPLTVRTLRFAEASLPPALVDAIERVSTYLPHEPSHPDAFHAWDDRVQLAAFGDGLQVVVCTYRQQATGPVEYALFLHEPATGRCSTTPRRLSGKWLDARGLFLRSADLEGDGRDELALLECFYAGTDTRSEKVVFLRIEDDLTTTEVLRFEEFGHGSLYPPRGTALAPGQEFVGAHDHARLHFDPTRPRTRLVLERWSTESTMASPYLGHLAPNVFERPDGQATWQLCAEVPADLRETFAQSP